MQIAVAQISPQKGNVTLNIKKHLQHIHLATQYQADAIFFPELSITGYEPTIAKRLNFTVDSALFSEIKSAAENLNKLVGIGAPVRSKESPLIGQILFYPNGSVNYYAKKHLHPDEIPFFDGGNTSPIVTYKNLNIGLAICYEISQDEHINDLISESVDIIMAPVAKSIEGITVAHERLSELARKHGKSILMSNCVGPSDDFIAAGQSAIWGPDGNLLQKLSIEEEGILIFDTLTNSCQKIVI